MYKCIAVETGKLTNYFILCLTVDPINIILGFCRSKGPNIMHVSVAIPGGRSPRGQCAGFVDFCCQFLSRDWLIGLL